MKRVALCGYGRMGKLIHELIKQEDDMEVVMIVDDSNEKDLYQLEKPVDLIIDFSHPDNVAMLSAYVKKTGCALLSGTTGLQAEQMEAFVQLGKESRVMYSANYSLGIAVFVELLKQITPVLEKSFDMEILETHHNQKQDAPSGTAKLLLSAMDPEHHYQEIDGRSGMVGKRGKEIGVHALRGGSVAGEHTVLYLGDDEKLEIKHTAISRQIFVNGAVHAAKWLMKQPSGFYSMEDMVKGEQ